MKLTIIETFLFPVKDGVPQAVRLTDLECNESSNIVFTAIHNKEDNDTSINFEGDEHELKVTIKQPFAYNLLSLKEPRHIGNYGKEKHPLYMNFRLCPLQGDDCFPINVVFYIDKEASEKEKETEQKNSEIQNIMQ